MSKPFLVLALLGLFCNAGLSCNTVTVTAKGTVAVSGVTSAAIASIATSTGDLLIADFSVGAATGSATYGATSMTCVSINYNGANTVYLCYLYITSGTTATVTASWSGAHTGELAVTDLSATGIPSSPFDVSTTKGFTSGVNTAPYSNPVPVTSQPCEFAWAVLNNNTAATIGGSWLNGWTDGQTIASGSSNVQNEGYLALTARGTPYAAKSGTTNSGTWGVVMATFKIGAAPTPISSQVAGKIKIAGPSKVQ